MKIAIVAGEASGDLLGSHLMAALKKHHPHIEFIGIGGPKMISAGAKSLFPIERLSVRGYVEVIKHLPGLLKLRRALLQQLLASAPDAFIGVDAPDFNFWLEKRLKNKGIPAIHYVSPSIWAWRKGRIGAIKKAVSHILALFPFEPAIYQKAGIPVTYVGHPLADILPIVPNVIEAREALKLKTAQTVIAMLPGSRQSEMEQHAALFIQAAHQINLSCIEEGKQDTVFLVPLITRETREIFENQLHQFLIHLPENVPSPPITVMFGHAHEAMEAADLVIVASGTATLEAALLKKPMIITYRMSNLSWQILKRMRLQPYVGLPNILAERFVVPELLQQEATPEKIAETAHNLLNDKALQIDIQQEFTRMHHALRQNTADKAAEAILKFL
ncbi:MAG TPA: lipid-A-disaccharide synthase [Methylophilaceae bacterium]|nr:lipid-A-disaccharide synthase [Methylophilaceae bacterium]